MSPGAIEETGKVAVSTIDAMKTQPLAVALVVVNVLFLAVGGYFAHDFFGGIGATLEKRDALVRDLVKAVASCPSSTTIPSGETKP
jgi:hypothetical protein